MSNRKNAIRPKPKEKPAPKKKRRTFHLVNHNVNVGHSVSGFLGGNFLTRETLARQIPFLLYLTFLAVLYIANSYDAEKTIIEINKTKKELEELRFSYITTKSELMFHSKQSEVALKLQNSGIKESRVPPVKLYVKNSD